MFYNDDKEKVEVSLVGKIIYDKKNGIYKVPLSEDLKEYLLDINIIPQNVKTTFSKSLFS